jgi:cation:H+ antiporter
MQLADIDLTGTEALILAIGALLVGIKMLVKGGDLTVDSAVFIANKYGISPLLVGFTIVAFGTSLPELIVGVNANLHDLPGIAFGNVLGSNIANILFVVGVTGFFTVLAVNSGAVKRDLVVMVLITVLLAGLMNTGDITRLIGLGMLALLFAYTAFQYWEASKTKMDIGEIDDGDIPNMWVALCTLLGGLVLIAIGAEFLVRGARVTAETIGIPEDIIALSIVAIGTSLPELSTCLIAARKKETDLVLGNIIGSNVFNILMILGFTAAIKPIDITKVDPQLISLDIWVTLGISVLFALILLIYKKINKPISIFFVGSYIFYIIYIYLVNLS